MICLGYHPLEVIRRCLTDADGGYIPLKACVKMFYDYFKPIRPKEDPYFKLYDKAFRVFVYDQQRRQISLIMLAVLLVKSLIKIPYFSGKGARSSIR